MVSARTPRVFNLYDVLGIFFPGTALIIGLYLLIPALPEPESIIQYLIIIVVAFSFGHFVQWYASVLTDELKIFDKTIENVQQPPSNAELAESDTERSGDETKSDGPPDATNPTPEDEQSSLDGCNSADPSGEATDPDSVADNGTTGDVDSGDSTGTDAEDMRSDTDSAGEVDTEDNTIYVYVLYAIVGPLIGLVTTPTIGGLNDLQNPNKVWTNLSQVYEFELESDRYEEMKQVISSHVDDPSSPARSYRFQAIRNFHRGMWVTSWICLGLLGGTTVYYYLLRSVTSHPLVQSYVLSTVGVWSALALCTVVVGIFWVLTVHYEKQFIRFLVTDYVVTLNQNEREQRILLRLDS